MSITAIGRTKPNWNSSARLQCTFTGDAVAMARRAASMASSPRFPPYPPPVGGTMTRTSLTSRPNVSASRARTGNGTLLPVQTVRRPSAHSATAALVSSGTWAR